MYDLSKMVIVEQIIDGFVSVGFAVKLSKINGEKITIDWFPCSDKEHISITKFRAEMAGQSLMNGILDILQEVSGNRISDYQIVVITNP